MKALPATLLVTVTILASARNLSAQAAGRIVESSGTVEVYRNNAWTAAGVNEMLQPGEKLRTRIASFAKVELAPHAAVTLSESSQITFEKSSTDRTYVAGGRRRPLVRRDFDYPIIVYPFLRRN